jgi:ATP-dependent RNA helicase DHX37/DHR1
LLFSLGAIVGDSNQAKLTQAGLVMSKFPLHPRFSKMQVIHFICSYDRILVAAQQRNPAILPLVIAIVAGLSVGDPFIREDVVDHDPEDEDKEAKKEKRSNYYRAIQVS